MSDGKPLLSVVTVCFNAAATITRTFDSVRAQTWRPLESVVVDGGSSDGTQAIAARYGDIAGAVVSEADRGIYDAMNKGIGLSRGEVLHFLNADDSYFDERAAEEVMRLFAADPELDLVFGDAIYVTGEGEFLRRYHRVNARNLIYGDLCHQMVFARRRLFERVGGFDLTYRINADYDWLLRVFRGGARVRYLPRAVAKFDARGWSSQNQARTDAERLVVRKRFMNPARFAVGMFAYRLQRKLRKLSGESELVAHPPVSQ